MKFFGFLWIVSFLSSCLSQTSLFKLPTSWLGSFFVEPVSAYSLAGSSPIASPTPSKSTGFSIEKVETVIRRASTKPPPVTVTLSPWSKSLRPYLSAVTNPVTVVRADQGLFEIHVREQRVAALARRVEADAIADRLRQLVQSEQFDPTRLQPAYVGGTPAGTADDQVLFQVDRATARALRRSREMLAIDWINSLRTALDAEPLPLAEAQSRLYGLEETRQQLAGTASWYGPYFHGRLTAAGETFNQSALTAAHRSLPFDTFLKVTNLQSGKSIIVRINDRGPYIGNRSLDLSRAAARHLGSEKAGVVRYKAVIMQPADR